ncbi:SOS response-associated peptidase [Yoonia sp. SDW83-1]|uniref:SOS response-associated peptidase n=1 Tax=Yoonia sp. SDW83-1 TaxID=3366945 RepID=UPI00398C7816
MMCNLYSMTSAQSAIRALFDDLKDDTGNLASLPGIYPDYPAPVIHHTATGLTMSMMRWGMPSPQFALKGKKVDRGVTNVRNTKSPHWRRWLGPDNRCVVPFNAFSEFQKGRGPRWFALTPDKPLAFFAGIHTKWTSTRKVKEGEVTANLFGFLTTDPNAVVAPIHPKAMPVILTDPDQVQQWLTAPVADALTLQRPLPDDQLVLVDGPE